MTEPHDRDLLVAAAKYSFAVAQARRDGWPTPKAREEAERRLLDAAERWAQAKLAAVSRRRR